MLQELSAFRGRLLPARPDLAATGLEGRVEAARFVIGQARTVAAGLLDLTLTPAPDAGLATQLLHGEPFTVYETRDDGLCWGQSGWDGYVGYVAADGLGSPRSAGRRITALRSHIYTRPDLKAPVAAALTCLAEVVVAGEQAAFARLADRGYVPLAHLAPCPGDPVAQARRFLGVPYLWGGRSTEGIDCSGLVQVAYWAAGLDAPRDSDMQEAVLGAPLPLDAPLARGDLVFWRGHVGLMRDAEVMLHANAHAMAVAEEPLAVAAARILEAGGGPVTGRRRPVLT